MGERTGLGVVEIALLEALETSPFLRCDEALARVEERIGLAPGYAYEVLVDLARPWTMPVNLVQGQGNFGSRGNDPPANFRYTEARITRAGRAALAAERGEMAPLPIAIINGNTHRAGLRPPFRPHAVIDAVREAIKRPDVTDADLTGMVGLPYFLTGCTVTGDLTALAAGRPTELSLQAQVSISDDRRTVIIENIPPNISTDDTASIIASRASASRWANDHPGLHRIAHLPLADLRDETSDRSRPFGRIVCIPTPGTPPEQLREMLLDVTGVRTTMPVALARPLPALIRHWVQTNASEDLLASLAVLEHAIPSRSS
jgi:DNA gyrase/topoisomerase IV subunit A